MQCAPTTKATNQDTWSPTWAKWPGRVTPKGPRETPMTPWTAWLNPWPPSHPSVPKGPPGQCLPRLPELPGPLAPKAPLKVSVRDCEGAGGLEGFWYPFLSHDTKGFSQ